MKRTPRAHVPVAIAGWSGLLLCTACASAGDLTSRAAAMPVFDPGAFFAGKTQGRGTLKVAFRRAEPTLVEGRGHVTGDGTIVLDQDVTRGDAPMTHRRWRLHRTGPNAYGGTLTDATGPVVGDVAGNRLHLAFRMKGGLRAQQWLYLRPGGGIADNRMVVTKFGIAVATLHEVIARQ